MRLPTVQMTCCRNCTQIWFHSILIRREISICVLRGVQEHLWRIYMNAPAPSDAIGREILIILLCCNSGLWSLAPNMNTRREQLWKTILNQQRQRRWRTMTGSILKLALFAGPEKSILCWMFLFADASCERRSSVGGCCSSREVDAHTRNGIFPVEKSQLVPLIAQHDRCPSDICSHRHNWRLTILVPGPTLLEMLWFDRSSTWDEIDKIIELFRFGD